MRKRFRHPLLWFFLIAFAVAWGTWIPAFFIRRLPAIAPMVGLFAPAIAAVAVTAAMNGKSGLRELFGRFRIWRFDVRWYAFAAVLMPGLYVAVAFLNVLVFKVPVQSMWVSGPAYYFMASFVWLLAITSGEEIGWRGFALPLLLNGGASRVYTASVFLGIVWAVWHAPIFVSGNGSMPYPIFVLLAIALSFVYTALFLRSGGSVWPALLLHAGTDFGPRLVHIGAFSSVEWLAMSALIAAAGISMLISLRADYSSAALHAAG